MAIDSRHYHYIVWLCWKITVMVLFWDCWMQWWFNIIFEICRDRRIMLLLIRNSLLTICAWSLKPTLLKTRVRLISNRYIRFILPFGSFKLRLRDRWVFIFLPIYKWIINIFGCSCISFIKICSLWSWSQLILSIHQTLMRRTCFMSNFSEWSFIWSLFGDWNILQCRCFCYFVCFLRRLGFRRI